MKQLLLVVLTLHIIGFSASGQDLKAKKTKTLGYYEEYKVLSASKTIKQGDYKKYRLDGSQVLSGKFDNNIKVGEWNYYENEELEQSYSYDEQRMIFQKKPNNPYSLQIENQIRVLNVDSAPTYIGSKIGLTDELNKVLNYPLQARRMGVEGPVTIGVWINEDNSLGEIQLIKGIMKDCDQEVISAVKKVQGNWIAATIGDKKVKSLLVLTVVYSLDYLSSDAAVIVK